MRGLQIDDHTYDIHKLQNQSKYQGQTRINEIEIDGVMYSGLSNVLQAISKRIAAEVGHHSDLEMDSSPTLEEEFFLSKLGEVCLTEEEKKRLRLMKQNTY